MTEEPRQEMIRWQALSGDPVTVGNTTITPHARALVLPWPWGGLVWAFPVSMTVEHDGQRRVVPVLDVTRIVQMVLFLFTIAMAVLAVAGGHSRKRGRHGRTAV